MNPENEIQFDTDQQNMSTGTNYTSRAVFGQPEVPGMAAWLIKKGIIKNENSAKGVLIVIVIANFVLTAAVIYFFVLK